MLFAVLLLLEQEDIVLPGAFLSHLWVLDLWILANDRCFFMPFVHRFTVWPLLAIKTVLFARFFEFVYVFSTDHCCIAVALSVGAPEGVKIP